MRFLKQNTATRVTVGPFFDKTDGVTPETSLTVTNCKLTLMVDDAGVPTLVLDASATASGGNNDMVHVTNDDAGFYDLELTAAQTNYVGRAMLAITDAANHCPVFHEFMIVPANVYDSLFGTDKLQVDAVEVSSDSTAADTLELFAEALDQATGQLDSGTLHDDTITAASINTGAITADAFAANAIVAATLAADCITEAKIADNAIAAEHLAANAIDFATFAADCKTGSGLKANVESISANAITNTAIADGAITTGKATVLVSSGTGTGQISLDSGKVLLQATQTGVTIPTVTTVTNQLTAAAIATGVWQDATAGDFTTASSIGKALYINNVAPGGSGGHLISGTNAGTTTLGALTVTGALTNGSTVLGNTTMGTLTQTGAVSWGATTFASVVVSGTTTLTGNVTLSGTLGTGAVTFSSFNTGVITGTLPAIPNNWLTAAGIASNAITDAKINTGAITAAKFAAGAIDAAAIANGAIDAATFAADVDAEVAAYIWNAATASYGGAGTYGQAVEDVLTDTAEIGTAGAGLSNIPWNASWDAQVESEVTDALNTYDPPTKAEMDAGHALLATAAELAKVPKSDGSATWNATALGSIQSECTDALNAYDPPTKAELDTAVANVSVDEIQASAVADLFNTDSGTTYAAAVAGSAVKEIADNAGGSSLTLGDIADAVWDEAQSGHTDAGTFGKYLDAQVSTVGGGSLTAADIADAVWDEASTGHTDAGKAGAQLWTDIDAILADTDVIGATGAGLTSLATAAELAKVPKSDSNVSWNATALAAINAEVDTALNTAIPGSPAANSINERIATMDGLLLGTIQAGTHVAQSGDAYAYLGTNLGALGANATEAGGTGDHLTALATAASLATVAGYIDTEVAAILAAVDTEVAAIKAKTDNLPTDPADQSAVEAAITAATSGLATASALADVPTNAELATALTTAWTVTTLAEDYHTTAATAATPAELLYTILSCVSQFAINSTTLTTYRLDGTTPSGTYTLDSSTAPTLRDRTT
jgi:hypothetical protein